ncbi:MAG: DUF424 family protein [Nanoarchaeota archaeon]|jgi:hypothetical protein|nr:DUF424 family protein [Nanoarchaeota archaeon]
MYINIIEAYRNIVAIADEELIGKKFFEGKAQLDVKESFYKGHLRKPEEVIEEIKFWTKEDATFNIVGKKSIQLALDLGVLHEDSIGKIDGTPYAILLL